MAIKRRNSDNSKVDGNDKDTLTFNNNKLKGDGKNIALLFLLYTIQGIPMGLSAAIPIILQNRGISYKQQAKFSFVTWPFSLKLLWAPIVDSFFISRFGRRKTWLIPTQYLLSATMILISYNIDGWLGSIDIEPNIIALTVAFFSLYFLAATQDIVVDGWALTMLRKENVGYASTCNSTGQVAGYFCAFVLFLALESAKFCNNYLRNVPSSEGLITLSGFLYFWGFVIFIVNTFVAIFKSDRESKHDNSNNKNNLKNAYLTLWKVIKMPSVRLLVFILLTCKIGSTATEAVAGLKLIEGGLSKETLGLIAVPLIPFKIIFVFFISKSTSGPKPLRLFLKYMPYRILFGFVAIGLVWLTPRAIYNGHIPIYFYGLLLLIYGSYRTITSYMSVAEVSFFAKISDPSVGGTYITLLNTFSNLGRDLPGTVSLWLVDVLTWRGCEGGSQDNHCNNIAERKECINQDGTCITYIDGYYIEAVFCMILGFIWLYWAKRKIQYLESLDESHWEVEKQLESSETCVKNGFNYEKNK